MKQTALPQSLKALIELLSRLPGIGGTTAKRLAFYILSSSPDYAIELAKILKNLHQSIKFCTKCFNLADSELCDICRDKSRDNTLLCVVARVQDLMNIEASGEYKGRYFVLGGEISPLDGITPDKLKMKELKDLIDTSEIKELILAMSDSLEADITVQYILDMLKDNKIEITRLASGIPVGLEIENADILSLKKALKNREKVN